MTDLLLRKGKKLSDLVASRIRARDKLREQYHDAATEVRRAYLYGRLRDVEQGLERIRELVSPEMRWG